ncbi:MAG: hypothetical protein ACI9LM_003701 [Alteromonadaceae bacterium]|jgi:hypothetical protein
MKILILLCIFITGCSAKLADLQPVDKKSYITLKEDIYQSSIAGIGNYKWVHGLKAGTYTLIGEDKDGSYFHNQGDAVIVLTNDPAELYLKTGEVKPYNQRGYPHGGPGGLWLPKDKTKKPVVYFLINTKPSDSTVSGGIIGMTSTPGSITGTGFVVGAITTNVISSMVNGSIQKFGHVDGLSDKFMDIEVIEITN